MMLMLLAEAAVAIGDAIRPPLASVSVLPPRSSTLLPVAPVFAWRFRLLRVASAVRVVVDPTTGSRMRTLSVAVPVKMVLGE